MLMLGVMSILALVVMSAFIVNGVFLNPKSGFNTIGNLIESYVTATLFSGAMIGGFWEYTKLKVGLTEKPMHHSKADHYRRHHMPLTSGLPYVPPHPPDYAASKVIEKHPYVTINGQEPEEPVSFFHTKKFYLSGAAFAVFAGLIMYFLVFT